MPVWGWIVIGIGAVALCLLIAWKAFAGRRRRRALQEAFGPEYERTVADAPTRREAESELVERRKRREQLDVKPLGGATRQRYADDWHRTQEHFVDDPAGAVGEADTLIQQVMRARGYPVENFEQRAADVSVDHPEVVSNYRAAHGISVANERGKASTEDLRTAMVHYRTLFAELVEAQPAETAR
jgi:hypothetical protein